MTEWLQLLSDSAVATTLRSHNLAYPLLSAAHILSLGTLLGAIITLDLRLLGVFRRYPVATLAPPLVVIAGVGLACALVTGFLLFSVRPFAYLENSAFIAKLILILFGLINIAILHLSPDWKAIRAGRAVHISVRVSALFSLFIWIGAVLAGRWIGFL